jgi:hypothetical protein
VFAGEELEPTARARFGPISTLRSPVERPDDADQAAVRGVCVGVRAALRRIPLRELSRRVVAGREGNLELPAFHLCLSRTQAIAWFICTVCVRDPPISGRSEAIR